MEKLVAQTKHLHGPLVIKYGSNEAVVLCVIKNGVYHLESFFEHYLSLGVKHFVFLDNNSTDETVNFICSKPNTTLLQTKLPFRRYEYLMREYLARTFGFGGWSLNVDIDEHFDFPFSQRVSLHSFLEYLNVNSYNAVVAYLLDMFGVEPIGTKSRSIRQSRRVKDQFQFYDLSRIKKVNYADNLCPHNHISNIEIKHYLGGIRSVIFGFKYFYLTKHPLIRLNAKMQIWPQSAHKLENANIADITGVLFHYKLTDQFPESVRIAVSEKSYAKAMDEYEQYLQVLQKEKILKFMQDTSKKLRRTDDLIDEQFLIITDQYRIWTGH